ncbi:MAG: FG-GAP-like repeat-containing protein [Candidatus Nanoarchaeia archaeon]|jgi:flagellin-like protein
MKAITPIISVVLLIMITVFASVSAYFFITSTMTDAEGGINLNTAFSDNSKLSIISLSGSKAIIKNDGKSSISEVIVFLNGEMFNYTFNPALPGGEAAEMYFSPQLAGEDLELKIFYGIGKKVSYTSPAASNTNDSGFVTITNPVVVSASIVENNTQLLGYCQASVYNASIESVYYYEWLLDEELNSSGSAVGNHDNQNYLLNNITSSAGSWNFKCLIGNGTYNSSLKTSAALVVEQSGSNEPDDTLIYCLSNNSRNTWFSGSITGSNGACCGDDSINDIFHNNTYLCSYGGVIFDEDNLYTEDKYGDHYNYSSGKGVCELNGNVWFENPVSFEDDVSYELGPVLIDLEFSDFDLDGDLDIVVLNQYDVSYIDAVFRVLFNDGEGGFSGETVYVVDGNIVDLSVADINDDGYYDILVVNFGHSELDVYLNDGDGTFTYDSYLEVNNPWDSSVGDVDNDGDLDVIVSTFMDDDISVFLNDGTGTLSYDDDWSDLGGTGDLKLADLNSDGNLDVINADSNSNTIRYRLGVGDATFGSLNTHSVGTNPIGLGIGDVDNDGNLDILTANNGSNSFSVCLGDGAGSFAEDVEYGFNHAPSYLRLGDLDNDGDLDVMATTQVSDDLMVSLNDGDGTFASSTDYGLNNATYALRLGDLNNDGTLDAATTYFQGDYYLNDQLMIILNNGITGTGGPCCGDDETTDDFYNSTNYCCNGAFDSGSCYCGDGVCQAWEDELSCSEDCISLIVNNASIIEFNGALKGYCNASSQNESQALTYYYNWTKDGIVNISGTLFKEGSLSTLNSHSCGITLDGTAKCWGYNNYGQLGIGNTTNMPSPVSVLDTDKYAAIAVGYSHSCGLTVDGTAKCWGRNNYGQLGNGSAGGSSSIPVSVLDTNKYSILTLGEAHSCGITLDGTAKCWGLNNYGQLGIGNTTNMPSPVSVLDNKNYKTITASKEYHTCGITLDGTAKCWGYNGYGELGIGNTTNMPSPVSVLDSNKYAAIAAGIEHSCGLTVDGTLKCWGYNSAGQLGIGNTTNMPSPVSVLDSNKYAAIAAGNEFSCGLTVDGTAKCWGINTQGQLGNGSIGGRSYVPVSILDINKYVAITAGYYHSCGLTVDGTAKCWGINTQGQLGIGNTTTMPSPVSVLDSSKYSNIKIFENKDLQVSTLYSGMEAGSWVFSCKVGNGVTNSSWKESSEIIIEEEPDNALAYCLSNYSRNTWFSGAVIGINGACCGDDGSLDNFYNTSLFCSYGKVVKDQDSLLVENFLADNKFYSSGQGICEQNLNVWSSSAFPNYAWSYNAMVELASEGQSPNPVIVDLDNNGIMDMVSAGVSSPTNAFHVWQNDGTPFDTWNRYNLGTTLGNVYDIHAADLDNDGDMDIITGETNTVGIYMNDGTPFSGSWTRYNATTCSGLCAGLAVADFDNDGWVDISVSEYTPKTMKILRNDHTPWGNWSEVNQVGSGCDSHNVAADWDNDGYIDLGCAVWTNDVKIFRNDGTPFSGTWSTTLSFGSSVGGPALGVADFDNDGWLDLAATSNLGIIIYKNDGTPFSGSWTSNTAVNVGSQSFQFSIGDLNNDGYVDLLHGENAQRTMISENDGTPFSGTWTTTTLYTDSSFGLSECAVGDMDNDGDLDFIEYISFKGWLIHDNPSLSGSNGPCCGDDGTYDNFSNSTHQCVNGVFSPII